MCRTTVTMLMARNVGDLSPVAQHRMNRFNARFAGGVRSVCRLQPSPRRPTRRCSPAQVHAHEHPPAPLSCPPVPDHGTGDAGAAAAFGGKLSPRAHARGGRGACRAVWGAGLKWAAGVCGSHRAQAERPLPPFPPAPPDASRLSDRGVHRLLSHATGPASRSRLWRHWVRAAGMRACACASPRSPGSHCLPTFLA